MFVWLTTWASQKEAGNGYRLMMTGSVWRVLNTCPLPRRLYPAWKHHRQVQDRAYPCEHHENRQHPCKDWTVDEDATDDARA